MAMQESPDAVDLIVEQIELTPEIGRLRELNDQFAGADSASVGAIVAEAEKFASKTLAPLNAVADREGCEVRDGRVRTPTGFRQAWQALVAAGWPTLDQPIEQGGQGLPLVLSISVQQMLDSRCMAFGMLPVLQRSAAKLIHSYGDEAMRAEWVPRLVSGEWAATICISEPDAGSDINRIRTRARRLETGAWSITGEKMWISFGDHDLTDRIGHCLLARTDAGLSLFLVPNRLPQADGSWKENAIVVRRVEEKMGLHGSPTCALGFEDARGWLIGTEGRGLAQMFVMITNMRISAGVQGLAGAMSSAEIAWQYAQERRQGGIPSEPPVAIAKHVDVQRQIMKIISHVEVVRGLANMVAVQSDLASHDPDPAAREVAFAITQWMLPILKTMGGQLGFAAADRAIQVLGGAGYTADWPLEQALRDSRVLTIYEGTTGIQGLDLLHRRLWRDEKRGMSVFLSMARQDPACEEPYRSQMLGCLALLEDAAEHLMSRRSQPWLAEAGATAFLDLAGMAATGWIAARLASAARSSASRRWLSSCGRHWLGDLAARAAVAHGQIVAVADSCAVLEEIFGPPS